LEAKTTPQGVVIARDFTQWISSRAAFLLPVRVLGALFRRLFLAWLTVLHDADRLAFFGSMAPLADRRAFLRHLSPVRKNRWVVYAKAPFAGREAVLAYLSRYTHRVAISNSRLVSFDTNGVTFRYKDYRRDGAERQKVMTLGADEFIRRFLLHVLPRGFHRIRHYGLLAASSRKASLDLARKLLAVAPPSDGDTLAEPVGTRPSCPCCGGHMIIIETFERWAQPRRHHHTHHRTGPARHDPAWSETIAAPRLAASGDGPARTQRTQRHSACPANPPAMPVRIPKSTLHHAVDSDTRALRNQPAEPLDQPYDKNPIAKTLPAAGSCIGGFRTPGSARNPSHFKPFPDRCGNGSSYRKRPSACVVERPDNYAANSNRS
jgi:hypothetical protein